MPTTWRHAISGAELERAETVELHYPWIRADLAAARLAAQTERLERARAAARGVVAERVAAATAPKPKPKRARKPKPENEDDADA